MKQFPALMHGADYNPDQWLDNPEILEEWRVFQQRDSEIRQNGEYRAFLNSEREFESLLGRACGNRVLQLFFSTLYEFCSMIKPEEDLYRDHPDRVRERWEQRSKIVDVIIEGDPDVAEMLARSDSRLTVSRLTSVMAKQSRTGPFNVDFPFKLSQG